MADDRAKLVIKQWDKRMRQRMRELVTDDLVAEHRRNPLGQHSDALERVLNYFRRMPLSGKYIAMWTKPNREWRILALPSVHGEAPRFAGDPRAGTDADALHEIFLRRVEDLKRP